MAEQYLFKYPGRVQCEDSDLLYELIRRKDNYFIKFYSDLGKPKLIKPISIPAEPTEIYPSGNHLLGYKHNAATPSKSYLFAIQFTHVETPISKCLFHLKSAGNDSPIINNIYFNNDLQLILFSDCDHRVYLLRLNDNDLTCKEIFASEVEINRIQLDQTKDELNQQQKIMLLSWDNYMTELTMDWDQNEVTETHKQKNVVDFYFGNDFTVLFTKKRDWQELDLPELSVHEEKYHIFLNTSYEAECETESKMVFLSKPKELVVINKVEKIIITMFDEVFRIYRLSPQEKEQFELCNQSINENSCVFKFKTSNKESVHLELIVHDPILKNFKTLVYPITKIQGEKSQSSTFIKKHFHNLINYNGLPEPIWYKRINRSLKEVEIMTKSYMSNEDEEEIDVSKINPAELGCKMMKIGLRCFPKSVNKIVHKIKTDIRYNREISYVKQTRRLFQFCESIQEEYVGNFYHIVDKVAKKPVLQSIDSQNKDTLQETGQIMQNMVTFLTMLITELKVDIQYHNHQVNLTNKQNILGNYPTDMQYYESINDSAKSILLVVKLLLTEDILDKFQERFTSIRQNQERANRTYQSNSVLSRMDYSPLFVHQYFQNYKNLLPKGEHSTFKQFFTYILANRHNLIEVAYFYQSIIRIASTPFLPSDICDLIENICFHIPRILDENELSQQRMKKSYSDLLHKMTGTVINMKQLPFVKYVIQLAVTYREYALATLLLHSGCFQVTSAQGQKDHVFAVKTLIIAGRIDLAHLYVLNNYTPELFESMIRYAKINGNISEVLQMKINDKFTPEEVAKIKEILDLSDTKWLQLQPCFMMKSQN